MIILLPLVLLTATVTSVDFQCPTDDPNGFFEHETRCDAYYQCGNGIPYMYECHAGTLWRQDIKACDWAANVKCDKKEEKKEEEKEEEKDEDQEKEDEKENDDADGDYGDKEVVCYFINWAWYRVTTGKYGPNNVDPTLCTIVNYAFSVLDNGKIKIHDPWTDVDNEFYKKIVDLKYVKGSRIRKVLLAIGGWNDSADSEYSDLVSSSSKRKIFNEHAILLLKKYGFDGLDLDWEYPVCWQGNCASGPASDKANFVLWTQELSALLKPKGMYLSAAVSAGKSVIDTAYDVKKLALSLDWLNLMSYDFHGSWDSVTGHNAPMYACNNKDLSNVDTAVKLWISLGFPARKIMLGLPIYGRSFTLTNSNNNNIGDQATGPGTAGPWTQESGFMAYYEICLNIKNNGWVSVEGDQCTIGPYAYKGNQWVGYDDETSVKIKMAYIKKMDLGGGMVWDISMDDFNGLCGKTKNRFLTWMRKYLSPTDEDKKDDDKKDDDKKDDDKKDDDKKDDDKKDEDKKDEDKKDDDKKDDDKKDDDKKDDDKHSDTQCSKMDGKKLRSTLKNLKAKAKFSVKLPKIIDGTTATISCKKGYTLKGNKVLTCQSGDWGQLPTCSINLVCNKKSAKALKKTLKKGNAKVKFSAKVKQIKDGSTAAVKCKKGYELKGESVLTCQNGDWGKLPTCKLPDDDEKDDDKKDDDKEDDDKEDDEEKKGNGLADVLTKAEFDKLFPHRNKDGKAAYKIFEYTHFLNAANSYPKFANEGTLEIRKREVVGFLANIAQETTGGWDDAPGGRYYWGLYYPEELGWEDSSAVGYCDGNNKEFPCSSGKSYHGRGPIQLSWNYNYGYFSQEVLGDKNILLDAPEKVAHNGSLAFMTGIWFWMTPQSPKPSCHDAITQQWIPNDKDKKCGRDVGFGATINIINGGVECGRGANTHSKTLHRVKGYQFFSGLLKSTVGPNLSCANQKKFTSVC